MNPTPVAQAFGTTLEPDANPLIGHLAAYAIALAALIAIGWGLYVMYRRRNRSAERTSLHAPRPS